MPSMTDPHLFPKTHLRYERVKVRDRVGNEARDDHGQAMCQLSVVIIS